MSKRSIAVTIIMLLFGLLQPADSVVSALDQDHAATSDFTSSLPDLGTMISRFALVGLLVLFPRQYGMSRRGYTVWPGGSVEGGDGKLILPTLRDSWWLLLISLAVMVGALA